MQTYCYTYIHTSVSVCLHEYMKFFFSTDTQQVYKLHIFPSIHTAISSYVQFVHTYSLEIFHLNYHVFTYFISQKHILSFLCVLTPTQNPIMKETQHLCVRWHSRKMKCVSWSMLIQSTCSTGFLFWEITVSKLWYRSPLEMWKIYWVY